MEHAHRRLHAETREVLAQVGPRHAVRLCEPGTVDFDDVVVKQIVAASPGNQAKVRRHSLETKITIKEMEENEHRSRKQTDPAN